MLLRWHLVFKHALQQKTKVFNSGPIYNFTLFWSFSGMISYGNYDEICISYFFYQQICIGVFSWCHIELRCMYDDKILPIFWTQYPFIFLFSLCRWDVTFWLCSYRGYTLEDMWSVLRESSTFLFSLYCKDWLVKF